MDFTWANSHLNNFLGKNGISKTLPKDFFFCFRHFSHYPSKGFQFSLMLSWWKSNWQIIRVLGPNLKGKKHCLGSFLPLILYFYFLHTFDGTVKQNAKNTEETYPWNLSTHESSLHIKVPIEATFFIRLIKHTYNKNLSKRPAILWQHVFASNLDSISVYHCFY